MLPVRHFVMRGLDLEAHLLEHIDHGATRDEVLETLGMAIYMGAGPSAMYASHALDAYTQFSAAKA